MAFSNVFLGLMTVELLPLSPGLTDAEIDKAIELAKGVTPTATMTTSQPSNQIVPPPLPPRPPPPPPQSRGWKDYAVIALVIGGVGYTVIQFVRVSSSE